MKIQGTGELMGRVPGETAAARTSPSKTGFGDILKNVMGAAPGAGTAAATAGARAAASLGPAGCPDHASLTRQVEGFLDLLEAYRCQLADSRVSLKGLDAAVRKMEQGRDTLTPRLESLAEGDGLRDILDGALVAAELEIMRFRRGDYLPA